MYRQNEAALVSGVLEHKLAGDRSGVVDAAVKLWLVPEERVADTDAAHTEVWSVLTRMDLVEVAAAAAVDVIRRGEKIRFHAFIDVGEAIKDPGTHAELAELALDHGWNAETYLLAALMRLVETNHEDAVLEFIATHRNQLAGETKTWSVIAAILTTTRVGKRQDLASWFDVWWQYEGVPMWIVQAYANTLMQPDDHALDQIVKIAERALESATPDITSGYFGGILAMADLRRGQDDRFRERMTQHAEALAKLTAIDGLEHPATRYLNRVKHKQPIETADLTYEAMDGSTVVIAGMVPIAGALIAATAAVTNKRPLNHKVGALLRDIVKSPLMMNRALTQFVQIYDVPRGSPEVIKLCEHMRKTRPSELPWLIPAWDRLVKARTTLMMRIKIGLGLDS